MFIFINNTILLIKCLIDLITVKVGVFCCKTVLKEQISAETAKDSVRKKRWFECANWTREGDCSDYFVCVLTELLRLAQVFTPSDIVCNDFTTPRSMRTYRQNHLCDVTLFCWNWNLFCWFTNSVVGFRNEKVVSLVWSVDYHWRHVEETFYEAQMFARWLKSCLECEKNIRMLILYFTCKISNIFH